MGLVGANGSGKSTLLDALSGVLNPDEGAIEAQGRSLASLPLAERARLMAFVPQKEKPVFAYPLRELVAMGRLAWGQGWRESEDDAKAIERALARTGLQDLADRSALEVSGGELQLALVARALCQEAPLLLMDEPTASLDMNRHALASDLAREKARSGGGVLAASHDLNWILGLCGRLVCLKGGRILWEGLPQDAKEPLEEALEVQLTWLETEDGPQAIPTRPRRSDRSG